MIRYFLVIIIPTHWKFQFWLVINPSDFQMSLHRMSEDIFSNHTKTLWEEKIHS